ncbi:CoaE-domain-containing protein [Aspergillus ellipticus CBS 707.79]|uniref:CoaE-domain-containing protein n=1 Tax=Aspergillus ellipticus CBS 707.79 TaxID=1448320 RepID=A0A319DQW2_9EURO|nr:CoaE-domain-containing protein [Aspergillus ellipticus CBS 707.79]
MLIIGLTGSIATGKSTVSTILSSPPYSLPIIDTDLLARKVVEPGTPGYNAIVKHFLPDSPDLLLPPSIPNDPSSPRPLNRPALGRRVFGTSEAATRDRAVLNGIVHPAVRHEIYKSLVYYYVRGYWAVVLDVPLLFESGMDVLCGTVVVVGVTDPAVQMARLRKRDEHLSAEEAENRVLSQGGVKGKVERAEGRGRGRGLVVWNDSGKEELEGEVRRAMKEVRCGSPQWWAWVLLLMPPVGLGVLAWNLGVNVWGNWAWGRKVRREKANL